MDGRKDAGNSQAPVMAVQITFAFEIGAALEGTRIDGADVGSHLITHIW